METPTRPAKAALVGREAECARLDQLLAEAHSGHSAVLVLRGDAGIGKSALLEYAADRATDCRVLHAIGAEWEMELPYAGLHQLCAGLLDAHEALPAPQRAAIATAFHLAAGAQPDRFLLGLAVLNLLSDAAAEHPLVCIVDDFQWLDRSSAQVLAFVARRLGAEPVVLLLAGRSGDGLDPLGGLPELHVGALSDASARKLLGSTVTVPMDGRVRERLLAETRGNPLALLELPRGWSPRALAGGFGLPGDESLPGQIEASFQRRVDQLPPRTQQLLLVAAADPTGEPTLLVRAGAELGISVEELAPAEADDLVGLGLQVAFRHPLLRSAIYRGADAGARREAHRALATATDAELDPDRRAWHRGHSADAPDETIAAELERSAERARARGGLAAAAAFLERSAKLTPDPGERTRRAIEAAATEHRAGDPQAALRLVATAEAAPLDDLDRAMLKRLHGQILLDLGRSTEALPELVDAARRLEPIDPGMARDAHMEAVRAAFIAGRLGPGAVEPARAARTAPPRPGTPRVGDPLLDGLALRFTDGYVASVPALRRALAAAAEERDEWQRIGPWLAPLPFLRYAARDLFDDDSMHATAVQGVEISRENGALAMLSLALQSVTYVRIVEGDLKGATRLLDESDAIATDIGAGPILYGRATLAGYRGIEAEALALWDATEANANARGEGVVLTSCEHARSVLYNGLGRHEAALGPAQSAVAQDELWASTWALPELVEAATGCGQADVANAAIEVLAERARATGTDWALGLEARSRALQSEGPVAEQLHRDAIDYLGGTRVAFELARARLLYGEWLRRAGRRRDAREELRAAHDMFASMGAAAFAARAEGELLAAGETARKHKAEDRDELTAQESQIAQLARDGLSNSEIGAQLFISPRTVEYHLHKVFTKLDVTGRGELARALP